MAIYMGCSPQQIKEYSKPDYPECYRKFPEGCNGCKYLTSDGGYGNEWHTVYPKCDLKKD